MNNIINNAIKEVLFVISITLVLTLIWIYLGIEFPIIAGMVVILWKLRAIHIDVRGLKNE